MYYTDRWYYKNVWMEDILSEARQMLQLEKKNSTITTVQCLQKKLMMKFS